nr:hypothetical protein CFP56_65373 [Quercus suber]
MGDVLGGVITAVLGCDLNGMILEVRLSERREEKGDGLEGMWIGYCRGWPFERSDSPAMWERRIGDVGGEMGFADVRESLPWWIGYIWSSKWAETRLSERREEREKNHQCGGENGGAARWSVGGPRIGVGVWGGALSPSR